MKQTPIHLAVAVALALGGSAAWAGGDKCSAQHTQADYQKMAEKMAAKGWLGLDTEKDAGGGYVVRSVASGSPAEASGIRAGDVLVALNGVRLGEDNKEALAKVKASLGPGKEVTYTIQRAGTERTVTATLAPVPRDVLAQWVGEHVLEHTTLVVAQAR